MAADADSFAGIEAALQAVRERQGQSERVLHGLRAVRLTLVAALALGILDTIVPLPGLFRSLILLSGIGVLLSAFRSRRRVVPTKWREQAAREVETRFPELDNALIHAVQFAGTVPQHSDTTRYLVIQEQERSARAIVHLQRASSSPSEPLRREQKRLLQVVGLLLITLVLAPRVWKFELPRLLLPWTDAPPFTLTDFHVTPLYARIRYGDSLEVNVRTGGLAPHRMELVTYRPGEPEVTLALTETGPDTHTALLENLTRGFTFFVRADTGQSRHGGVEIFFQPRIQRLTARLSPPKAAVAPQILELPLDGRAEIRAATGTQITLSVEADLPIAGGELILKQESLPPATIPLAVDAGRRNIATAEFRFERSGTFHLGLNDPEGEESKRETVVGKLVRTKDENPAVVVVAPGKEVLAQPDTVIPISVEAEDDSGLTALELRWTRGAWGDVLSASGVQGKAFAAHTFRLDLRALGAKPGDVVTYQAYARDDAVDGAHFGTSARFRIAVVSPDDYKKALARARASKSGKKPGKQSGDGIMPYELAPPEGAGRTAQSQHPAPRSTDRNNLLSGPQTQRVEPTNRRPSPTAADAAPTRYPPEYRRLVEDYFKAVSRDK